MARKKLAGDRSATAKEAPAAPAQAALPTGSQSGAPQRPPKPPPSPLGVHTALGDRTVAHEHG
jgi:hypothetical protein